MAQFALLYVHLLHVLARTFHSMYVILNGVPREVAILASAIDMLVHLRSSRYVVMRFDTVSESVLTCCS